MTLSQSILATLVYHDIFNYPLTTEEIHKYLIKKKISAKSVEKELKNLKKEGKILNYANLFALKNKKKLFLIRKQRAKHSHAKLKKAQLFSFLLSLIPTVKMVAISGALAMQNSHKNDDIDLVIVTAKGKLWTTRLLANLVLLPFKRRPQLPTTHYLLPTNNKACLNLFIDESDLEIKDQNLYTAHELYQQKPLFERNQTYSRMMKANRWALKYLPNWHAYEVNRKWKSRGVTKKQSPFSGQYSHIETLAKKFQLAYMKSKISSERIGDTQLFFHPKDTQERVLKKYKKKCNGNRLLTSPA